MAQNLLLTVLTLTLWWFAITHLDHEEDLAARRPGGIWSRPRDQRSRGRQAVVSRPNGEAASQAARFDAPRTGRLPAPPPLPPSRELAAWLRWQAPAAPGGWLCAARVSAEPAGATAEWVRWQGLPALACPVDMSAVVTPWSVAVAAAPAVPEPASDPDAGAAVESASATATNERPARPGRWPTAPLSALPSALAVPADFRRRALGDSFARLAWVALALAMLLCVVVVQPGAWVMLGTLVIGVSIALRQTTSRQKLLTMLLGLTVGVTAVDYMTWRFEVSNWLFWWIAAPLVLAEAFGALHTLGLQYTVWPWPAPRPNPAENPTARPIFIFIPTVNEGPAVLTPTLKAVNEARQRYLRQYPQGQVTIVVCNDGRVANAPCWRDVEALAQRMGVVCVTRVTAGGAKAGNLEHARQLVGATGPALVVIFDADQVAEPEFLLKTVPPFSDPSVGWVQTGQYYGNLEQPVARWAHDQQALFYRLLCPGKAAHNAAFICGTNVVIRAAALDQIGGLPQDSVTEDFAASIRLHPDWRSVFLTERLATGLGPLDMAAYLRQQRRWAMGTLGVLRRHWSAIFLPHRRGLRLDQRIQYALACTHYLCGVRDFIYLLAPLVFLITGIPAVRGASLEQFLWHFVPYFVASQGAFWYVARKETGLRGIIIGFGSFPVLILALGSVVLGRQQGFAVTSKTRRTQRTWSHLLVYGVALVACLAGLGLAVRDQHVRPESVFISVMWVFYDIALLLSVLWLGIADLRYKPVEAGASSAVRARPAPRSGVAPPAVPVGALAGTPALALAPVASRASIFQPTMRRTTAAVSSFMLISSLFLISSSPTNVPPVRFRLAAPAQSAPTLGLSLPYQLLESRPQQLATQLCLPFTVIGRTQDIQDSFDFSWAQRLAADGQQPWITLQFGVFGANGLPPLDASLPAIANGVQDANIARWAQAIHTYGKPVYLTILLHVDRNWSVSSAVANGGIPQDAPRAWEHVRELFRAAGDTNVAWVWAPADPANDEVYAPPPATIDAVLQSMIRYPNTPWPDPNAVLAAVSARYPGKPLLVEVTASGPAPEKSAWLTTVASAIRAYPSVVTLLYHEGSPDIHATATDAAQWVLESDARSLAAVRGWQTLVPRASLPCAASAPTTSLLPLPVANQIVPAQPMLAASSVLGQAAVLADAWRSHAGRESAWR